MANVKIEAGCVYRIRNMVSGLYMSTAPEYKNDLGTRVEQFKLVTEGDNVNTQLWHILPVFAGSYLIVNKHTGLCLNIEGYETGDSYKCQLWLLQEDAQNRKSQLWEFHDNVPADHLPEGHVRILNSRSQRYLYVEGFSDQERFAIQQNTAFSAKKDREFQSWRLEKADEVAQVVDRPKVQPLPEKADIIRLESHEIVNWEEQATKETLVAQVLIPFPMVRTYTNSPADLAQLRVECEQSPYYFLNKYLFWKCRRAFEHPGGGEDSRTEFTRLEVRTETSVTQEQRTSISVTASSKMELEGASNELSTTITHEFNVTTSEKHESTEVKERTDTVKLPAYRCSNALWVPVWRYALARTDGTELRNWAVVSDGSTSAVWDRYPRDK